MPLKLSPLSENASVSLDPAVYDMAVTDLTKLEAIDNFESSYQGRLEPSAVQVKQVKLIGRNGIGIFRGELGCPGNGTDPQQEPAARCQHPIDFSERAIERHAMVEGRCGDHGGKRSVRPGQL